MICKVLFVAISFVVQVMSLSSTPLEHLRIKLEEGLEEPSDCAQFFQNIETFFNMGSEQAFNATRGQVQWDAVYLQLPSHWQRCYASTPMMKSRPRSMPMSKLDVLVSSDSEYKLLRVEGCGIQGQKLRIPFNAIEEASQQSTLTFMVRWSQYRFGLFDEHVDEEDSSYLTPRFHLTPDGVRPTSCVNVPLKGEFGLRCLEQGYLGDECDMDARPQNEITSSLLYSSNLTLFPRMSLFCNDSTHDQGHIALTSNRTSLP